MPNYEEARVKVKHIKLSKLKSAAKNKTWTTLRITNKNVQHEELSFDLFLTTRQKTKIRNAFTNSKSTDIKLYTAQLLKSFSREDFLIW